MRASRSGRCRLQGRAVLAPLSGVTDVRVPPDRAALRRRSRGVRDGGVRRTRPRLRGGAAAGRRGRDRRRMSSSSPAATRAGWRRRSRVAEAAGRGSIDINMGCPAKRVIGGYAGSALMRDLDQACRIIEATVAAATRAGDGQDAARLGRRHPQRAGARPPRRSPSASRAVTVHGRTRQQFYKGSRRLGRHRGGRRRRSRSRSSPTATSGPSRTPGAALRAPDAAPSWSAAPPSGGPGSSARSRAALAGPSSFPIRRPTSWPPSAIEHYEGLLALYGSADRHPPCPQASRRLCRRGRAAGFVVRPRGPADLVTTRGSRARSSSSCGRLYAGPERKAA